MNFSCTLRLHTTKSIQVKVLQETRYVHSCTELVDDTTPWTNYENTVSKVPPIAGTTSNYANIFDVYGRSPAISGQGVKNIFILMVNINDYLPLLTC